MKKFLYISILAMLFVACGEVDEPHSRPISITVGSVPTIKIGESATIKFTVSQEDHAEDFRIYATCSSTTAQVQINGEDLTDLKTISQNKENTITFENPRSAKKYKISLRIFDKNNVRTTKEISINVENPQYETKITFQDIPDFVKVEASTEIKFTVAQQGHAEDFKIEVDTIVPSYQVGRIVSQNGTPILYGDVIFGSAQIKINGEDLTELMAISPNNENILTFSNPTAVGEYKIKLKLTDNYQRVFSKEIVLTAISPEIEIKWYSQDLLSYMWESDIPFMYEKLNEDFSINPLSESLKEKRISNLYTQEIKMAGCTIEQCLNYPCDGKCTTYPGGSILIHVSQEGGEPMQYVRDFPWFFLDVEYTSHWIYSIDGKDSWGLGTDFKQGFHGVRLQTSTLSKVGTIDYTIRVVDKWGKEHISNLPYKCFGINETIPIHLTHSDEYPYWWFAEWND